MVYIDRNGRVWEKRPWDLARITEIFMGIWFVILQLFHTLIAPFMSNNTGGSNTRRSGWGPGGSGGGGGGGGGSGGRGSGNGGYGPNRRIGRVVNTSMDCNIPGGG